MDTIRFRVLDIVMGMVSEGEFTVIDKTDIITGLGQDMQSDELDAIMESLELHDMIVIRYTDDTVYGIAPRPKGKLAYEKNKFLIKRTDTEEVLSTEVSNDGELFAGLNEVAERLPSVRKSFSYRKMAIICGISSFFGGFVAAAVAYILTRIL